MAYKKTLEQVMNLLNNAEELNMMSKIKLKPCPFCGDEDVSIEENYDFEKYVKRKGNGTLKDGDYVYRIWCHYCNFMLENYEKGSKKELAEWWNIRVG